MLALLPHSSDWPVNSSETLDFASHFFLANAARLRRITPDVLPSRQHKVVLLYKWLYLALMLYTLTI